MPLKGQISVAINKRVSTPTENDFADIADIFVRHEKGLLTSAGLSPIAKVVKASEFTENDRWDVTRFWSEDELVGLGKKESAVARTDFIDEVRDELGEILIEPETAKSELLALTAQPTIVISLNDDSYSSVRSGTRVTNKEIRDHVGALPIYSCFRTEVENKGFVDEIFFSKVKNGVIEDHPIVTVNANGASVGKVFVRNERCGMTDDVNIVELVGNNLDISYVAVALQDSVNKGGFLYEAKLFTTRVRELSIEVPIGSDGGLDIDQQRMIASAVRRFNVLRMRLRDLGERSVAVRAV